MRDKRGRARCENFKFGTGWHCGDPAVVCDTWTFNIADLRVVRRSICRPCLLKEYAKVCSLGIDALMEWKETLRPLPGKPDFEWHRMGEVRKLFGA